MPPKQKTLTEKQKAEVETLAAFLSIEQMADYFGCSERHMQNIMDRDETIRASYKRGKAKAIGKVAQGLLQKALAGDTTSSIFYLKTQARWRETNPPPKSDSKVTVADLEARLASLATDGDRVAILSMLAALDPARYGPPGRMTLALDAGSPVLDMLVNMANPVAKE
jgi:hypothetical protein